LKSLIHPTFGHTLGAFDGTEQNFVYMVSCVTSLSWTLKPSCSSCDFTTWAVSLPGGTLSPTIVIVQCAPSHFPDLNPAFFMYFVASFMSPLECLTKSYCLPDGPL